MRRIVVVLVGLMLLAGCGSKGAKGAVSGKLTYNGQPVNGALLTLYPGQYPIPVSQEGEFNVTAVPNGEYKVVVEGTPGQSGPPLVGIPPEKMAEAKEKAAKMSTPATIKFPDKYKSEATTPLKMTISGGSQNLNLELKD
jgi:hypothetical protein